MTRGCVPAERRLRVLIVEDEGLLSVAIEDMLVDSGHAIAGAAARLHTALQLAQRAEFDVAILDVNLEGQSSYPVADVLRARGIPFVFTTGYGAEGLDPHFRDAAILAKPYSQADLVDALERITGGPARQDNP